MTSNPQWGEKTSGLEVAKAFSEQVRGKNILITGVAPDGCGEGTALALASQHPAALILASRTQANLDAVAAAIRDAFPHLEDAGRPVVHTVLLDLASQASIRRAAEQVKRLLPDGRGLDLLVNNAGVTGAARRTTAEGIELQLGVNHVGHFLLTNLLMPLLLRAAQNTPARPGSTRIVNLTSEGHRISPVRFHDLDFVPGAVVPPEEAVPADAVHAMPPVFRRVLPDGYMPLVAYGQSKTANILFSLQLQRRLKAAGVRAVAVHPGGVATRLGRDHDDEIGEALKAAPIFWKDCDQGAATTVVAALDPALDNTDDIYLSDCQVAEAAPYARDPQLAERLWKLSEALVGETFSLGG